MRTFIEKLLAFLRIRSVAVGLEVSDEVVRLVYFNGRTWQLDAVRLAPGVLTEGKINDRDAFVASLTALKERVQGTRKAKLMNVVLCLSDVPAYTQVFSLPAVRDENFDEAVDLNLKMASPTDADKAYSGWQVVGRNEETFQSEVLASFMDRETVDAMVGALFEAGFPTMAVESRALALTRMLREKGAGLDTAKPSIFVNIDNSGIDFLIIRNGALYFEYAETWRDLVDEKGEIPVEKFKDAVTASARQVVNFYEQHWHEPLQAIIISAVAFEKEAEEAITQAAPAPVVRLTLVMGQPISPEWLAALGCSLRHTGFRAKNREISFLGEESQARFHEAHFLEFIRFWRIVVPAVFGILLIMFGVADLFLVNTKTAIESRADFGAGSSQASAIASLQSSAKNFNQLVSFVKDAEGASNPKSVLLNKLSGLASSNRITITHVAFQSFSTPMSLSGSGRTEDDVTAFETAMKADSHFTNVDLPLTSVQTFGTTVTFSMTFDYHE